MAHGYQGGRLPSVDATRFAMVPGTDVPRSKFTTQHRYKTTFDAGQLIPIFCREILPGDVFHISMTHFARMATFLFPVMDSLYLETFGFFTPNRILWDNWVKLQGQQDNPGDSISYTVPQIVSPVDGFLPLTLYDYMGLPTKGQTAAGKTISVNALPFRAHNLIWNEWFRDENQDGSQPVSRSSDGPDPYTNYGVQQRRKRKDYFTGALPTPQKNPTPINMPIGGLAPITGLGTLNSATGATFPLPGWQTQGTHTFQEGVFGSSGGWDPTGVGQGIVMEQQQVSPGVWKPAVYADLNATTGVVDINEFRLAIMTQSFLEKQNRGGTRYTEFLQNIFRVHPEDWRLQRPEYIGGGKSVIDTHAIAQTSATSDESPLGNLGATSTMQGQHKYQYHAKEHGWIMIYACVRAEITYQQGLHKQWTRKTQLDHYLPSFAQLGEQAILNYELWSDGNDADNDVFGYQERWSEYRTNQSQITGMFKSSTPLAIDQWHLAQYFVTRPTLSTNFIQENPPVDRVVAAGDLAAGLQVLWDSQFNISMVRPLPMFSIPATLGRF